MTTTTETFVKSMVVNGRAVKITRVGRGLSAPSQAYLDGERFGKPGPQRHVEEAATSFAEGSLLCPWLLAPGHEGGELDENGCCKCGFNVQTGEWS